VRFSPNAVTPKSSSGSSRGNAGFSESAGIELEVWQIRSKLLRSSSIAWTNRDIQSGSHGGNCGDHDLVTVSDKPKPRF